MVGTMLWVCFRREAPPGEVVPEDARTVAESVITAHSPPASSCCRPACR